MLCELCKKPVVEFEKESSEQSLWGFYPYKYSTYNDMKYALDEYIENMNQTIENTYNSDGYTYTQWYIYFLSKNKYQYKKWYKPTIWLFQILSVYPFFKDMIKKGTLDDHSQHTLLHFMKYLEKWAPLDLTMVNLLTTNGLSMEDENKDGESGNLYLSRLIMKPEDKKSADSYTSTYKTAEYKLFSELTECIRKCEKCNDPISKYEDMIIHSHKFIGNINLINSIIEARQACNDIYQLYSSNNNLHRHKYVVDMYLKLLDRLNEKCLEMK